MADAGPYRDRGSVRGDAAALEASLGHAAGLLVSARVFAVALDRIDIPTLPDPPLAGEADRAILQSVGPLYLAMEVESTGLTRALSLAAGLYMTGGLRLGEGEAARLLREHHGDYERRRPSDDRHAAYLRLFGAAPAGAVPYASEGAVNAGFEEALLRLAEALHRYANLGPAELSPTAAHREIRTAARLLGEAMVMRGGGASLYIAEEALGLIATATTVFKDRAVQSALGARDLWSAVAAVLATAWEGLPGTGPRPRPGDGAGARLSALARAHLARGKAGMMLIEWLAQEAPRLHGVGVLRIDREAPILAQGTAWLEATLSLLSSEEAIGHVA
jgi:hypothetical protein